MAAKSTSPITFAPSPRFPGFEYPPEIQKGFKADVICDDVGYSDEPFFQDGLIGNAVDDVFAAGVSYFSSAGNDIGTYDYDSDYRNVPNGPGATRRHQHQSRRGADQPLSGWFP